MFETSWSNTRSYNLSTKLIITFAVLYLEKCVKGVLVVDDVERLFLVPFFLLSSIFTWIFKQPARNLIFNEHNYCMCFGLEGFHGSFRQSTFSTGWSSKCPTTDVFLCFLQNISFC